MGKTKIGDLKAAIKAFDTLVYVVHENAVHEIEDAWITLIVPNLECNESVRLQIWFPHTATEIWVSIDQIFTRRVEAEYALAQQIKEETK